jgi:hypothetical protein
MKYTTTTTAPSPQKKTSTRLNRSGRNLDVSTIVKRDLSSVVWKALNGDLEFPV